MNTEVYDTRIVSGNYMAYTMSSGHTLYVEEYIPGDGRAYTLAQPDGQGLTWNKADSKDEPWVDGIISNAVNRETNLNRLAQLLGTFGVESHWCNHVRVDNPLKETTINAIIPEPEDDNLLTEPHRIYTIKTSDTGMTWVHIYKWVDMRAATDPTDAMNVIRNNEQQEQA